MTDKNITHECLVKGHLVYDHLLGKVFVHGEDDCYEHLRSMYRDNLGIELTNYARPNDWWLDENRDLYRDNFANEGFQAIEIKSLDELHILDVMLIAIPDPRNMKHTVTNHCAVYVGNGFVTHHRYGILSNKVPYRGALRNFTTQILRHKDVPDIMARNETTIDMMDHILPHKRELIMRARNERTNSKD